MGRVPPHAPVRWLNVNEALRSGIDPLSPIFADRKYQPVNAALIDHTDLKIRVGWRNRNWQPFLGQSMQITHAAGIARGAPPALMYINALRSCK